MKKNTMVLAHHIRKELKLEGHYHAQMSFALIKAWAINKGETTLDIVLGTGVSQETIESKIEEVHKETGLEELIQTHRFLRPVYVAKENGIRAYVKTNTKMFATLNKGEAANTNVMLNIISGTVILGVKGAKYKLPNEKVTIIVGQNDVDRFKAAQEKAGVDINIVVCNCL